MPVVPPVGSSRYDIRRGRAFGYASLMPPPDVVSACTLASSADGLSGRFEGDPRGHPPAYG